MLDDDLATMYQVETRVLNQAVKRNSERFPEKFRFQLTENEFENLRSQFVISSATHGGRRYLPYVFTEQGVAMLSAVLRSDVAVQVSIQIMEAFVQMRKLVGTETLQQIRISKIEDKLIGYDQNFEKIFKALEHTNPIPTQGVFFDGQIFDAYALTSRIIRSAKKSIVLIDNYVDENTLLHLTKKKKDIQVMIFTKNISKRLLLDVKKANQQYGGFIIKPFDKSHDRFLIIDDEEIYHLGASLKDLGKKWFVYTKMDKGSVESILNKIKDIE